MKNDFYWNVYMNLEKEMMVLSNLIHIDDFQINIYSIKIAELLLRTVVEVESISKALYFDNGGSKFDDSNLFFDTDCIDFLENKWILSKKEVYVTSPFFYFTLDENKILTPLKKANKRGHSSADWMKAYQAVKHNRATSLAKANIKHLIRALAALYLLNLYYKDEEVFLGNDSTASTFDRSIGSRIFSINLHIDNTGIQKEIIYVKNQDFDKSVYLHKTTNKSRGNVLHEIEQINSRIVDKTIKLLQKKFPKIFIDDQLASGFFTRDVYDEAVKIKNSITIPTFKENSIDLRTTIESITYEVVLNKNQF